MKTHCKPSNAESPEDVVTMSLVGIYFIKLSLQWRDNEGDGVSDHQPHDFFTQPFIQAQIIENIRAPRHWPLCGEFTGHRWIPHIKGQ